MSRVYSSLLDRFVTQSNMIISDITGIYLHGSAVMGCFNPDKSDLDLIIVVKDTLSDDTKKKFMDMVVDLNEEAPSKGIELSIVRESVCDPFIYPTPFELHFSIAHLEWYRNDPEDYIAKMKGTDKDLAAHFTIIIHRGKALYGKPVSDVFGEVEKEYYFDSIWSDIENAAEDINDNPMYIILNLSRVLAYKKDNLILSKKEGGEWALANIPEEYHPLIISALSEYSGAEAAKYNKEAALKYAEYMLNMIRHGL